MIATRAACSNSRKLGPTFCNAFLWAHCVPNTDPLTRWPCNERIAEAWRNISRGVFQIRVISPSPLPPPSAASITASTRDKINRDAPLSKRLSFRIVWDNDRFVSTRPCLPFYRPSSTKWLEIIRSVRCLLRLFWKNHLVKQIEASNDKSSLIIQRSRYAMIDRPSCLKKGTPGILLSFSSITIGPSRNRARSRVQIFYALNHTTDFSRQPSPPPPPSILQHRQ